MIKAIIFDFDGVIINTYENHYQTYKKKFKNLNREIHKKIFEGNIHELVSKLEVKDKGINELELLRKHLIKQKIEKEILETLKKLKKNYELHIISSNKESTLKEFFEKNDLQNLFDSILGYETCKKKDVKFKMLLEKYSLKKKEVIFVSDTTGDVLEARKIGIKTIAVDFGFHEKERLKKVRPLKIISKFSDLIKVIKSL